MTREEKLDWLCRLRSDLDVWIPEINKYKRIYKEVLMEEIKALKQEPTTKNNLAVDCISIADVNQVIEDYICEQYHVLSDRTRERALGARAVKARINELHPVTTQPKTGHWIEHEHNGKSYIECSECLCWFLREHLLRNSHCPNCGSRNVAESEDKTN